MTRKRLSPAAAGRSHTRISRTLVRSVDASISASIERCALLAALLKLSPSRRRLLCAVIASICWRSFSCRFRSRAAESLRVEVMLVQRSLQPPPLPGLRVVGDDVVLALARHVEAGVPQRRDEVGAAAYDAVLDALHQAVADELARVGLDRQTGPQVRRVDVGAVAGLLRPGAGGVVGPAPAVLVVEAVAQRAEGLLPAGGRDVQAPAGHQVAAGGEDVHVDLAAVLAVLDGRPGVAVRLEPGPGSLPELVEDGLDLRVGRPVLRRPGDHAGGVLVLELERVGDGGT